MKFFSLLTLFAAVTNNIKVNLARSNTQELLHQTNFHNKVLTTKLLTQLITMLQLAQWAQLTQMLKLKVTVVWWVLLLEALQAIMEVTGSVVAMVFLVLSPVLLQDPSWRIRPSNIITIRTIMEDGSGAIYTYIVLFIWHNMSKWWRIGCFWHLVVFC
jgi:hypothetical protein